MKVRSAYDRPRCVGMGFGWISDGFARSARDTDVVAIVRGWTPPLSNLEIDVFRSQSGPDASSDDSYVFV